MKFIFTQLVFACFVAMIAIYAMPISNVQAQDEKADPTQDEKTEEGQESADAQPDGSVQEAQQEGEPEGGTDAAADDSLAGLKLQWIELNKQIDAQQVVFDEAEESVREAEQKKYDDLIEQAHSMIAKMKQTAIDELATAEEKKPVFETLLGIMINDANYSRDEEVLRVGDILIENDVDPAFMAKASKADRLALQSRLFFDELIARQNQKEIELPQVKISTSKGDVVIELFEIEAPDTVGNFISLVEKGFYEGLTFHRVMDGFMAQGGCPDGDGRGGPGYNIFSEFNKEGARNHFTGSLSMANTGPDTAGSQFFMCFVRPTTPILDGKHTVFGRIIEGMDVLPKIQRRNPENPDAAEPDTIVKMEVIRKTEGKEYKPNIVPGSETVTEDSQKDGSEGKGADGSGEKSGK